jgi:hypothetical protein
MEMHRGQILPEGEIPMMCQSMYRRWRHRHKLLTPLQVCHCLAERQSASFSSLLDSSASSENLTRSCMCKNRNAGCHGAGDMWNLGLLLAELLCGPDRIHSLTVSSAHAMFLSIDKQQQRLGDQINALLKQVRILNQECL